MAILDVQLWELGTQRLHQGLSETILVNTLTDVREFKKKDCPLEKYTANYNWKYAFKSQKKNKEVSNAISLRKFLDLYNPSSFSEFRSRGSRLTKLHFLPILIFS